jgi:hypothetical protein
MQNLIPLLVAAEKSRKCHGALCLERTIFCLTSLPSLAGGDFAPLYARARARLWG